jgi:hypothetical protein
MLPVRWKSVLAEKKDKHVEVKWVTLTEQNTDRFTVQHSVNGSEWKEIGTVKAAGKSNLTMNYVINHYMPEVGLNYYRIQQFDLDGKFEYSAIVKLMNNDTMEGIKIVTNPVVNGNMRIISGQQIQLMAYSLDGKPMAQTQLHQGENNMSVSNWLRGMYIVKTPNETIKVVIQ